MKTSQTTKMLRERFRKIHNRFSKLKKKFAPKDIHLFRLQVKKLRATLRLASASQKHLLELPKKLRAFYKEVGVIRSLQIQQQRIHDSLVKTKSDASPREYLKIVKDKITRGVKRASSMAMGKAPFKKEVEELMGSVPKKLTLANSREFMWKESTSLKNLMDSFFNSDEALHATRKLVKDLLFVWPKIKSEAAVILPSAILCSKEDLRFISKRLGKFQDAFIGLELLQENETGKTKNEKEITFLMGLEKKWNKEKDGLRSEIHQLFLKRIPARPTFSLLADGDHSGVKNKLLTH